MVDADAYERDGVNYLVVRKILENGGIVLKNDQDYGIVRSGVTHALCFRLAAGLVSALSLLHLSRAADSLASATSIC